MLLVKWEFCVCSCILIITQTFSNFSVFSCSTAVCIKGVCVPRDGSHKCNFQKKFHLLAHLLHRHPLPPLPPPSSSSSVAVRHLFHIPAIKVLHGFQCLVAVGYEAEEQARFRRFNPDQKEKTCLLLYYSSSSSSSPPSSLQKEIPKQSSLHDARRIDGVVCGVLQESSGISAQIWPSFMQGVDLIWSGVCFLKMELLLTHLPRRQSAILYYHWYWSYPDVSTCVSQSN